MQLEQTKKRTRPSLWIAAAVMAGVLAACGDDGTSPPATGSIEVTVSTAGAGTDPDGYTVLLDGGSGQAVAVSGTVTFADVSTGSHEVMLQGLAANCSVAAATQTVNVPGGGAATVTFTVSCSSTLGSLVVTTTTSGDDPDLDGYTVTVDGGLNVPIGVSATQTINNVEAGARTVALGGVADNCTVTAPHPRTVTVVVGSSVQTDFVITCTNITGTVDVVTSTTGVDIDASGYTVTVEGRPPVFIDVNDTVSVSGAIWGDRTVTLSNVDANCTVAAPGATRTVAVPQRDTVETVFTVTCVALTGTLTVMASTTGTDLDPDGYMVSVDGGPAQALAINGQVVFNNATTGDRSVLLTGLAPNCSVTGNNPATVTVPPQGNMNHTFNVTCSTLVGSVEVTTVTTGSSLDPDGYSVTVGALAPVAIGVSATQTVGNVPIGMRSVQLTGLAANCYVSSGENPRMVTVTDGGTATTTFNVSCFAPLSNKIAFDTNRDGQYEIYVMNPNGTGVMRLTNDPGRDAEPNISFNGTKIAFVSRRDGDDEIWVMNADGSNPVQLTDNGFADSQPAWSPDGTKIAFRSDRNGNTEVWVMNADGTNPVNMTNDAAADGLPDWSPDGTKILFNSNRDGDQDVYVMDAADGGNVTQLTNNAGSDFAASWSPNGSKIAFTSDGDGDSEIWVMNADGSGQTRLTDNAFADLAPQWSPNGAQLAFASDQDGSGNEVFTMSSSDGSSQTNITNNMNIDDFEVSWR